MRNNYIILSLIKVNINLIFNSILEILLKIYMVVLNNLIYNQLLEYQFFLYYYLYNLLY